jgi:hypothetical protein
MKRFLLAPLLAAVLVTAACPTFVTSSVDTLAAAQGFIAQAQINHQIECSAAPTKAFPCATITTAVAAQNAAVSALEAYCQLPVAPDPATLKAQGTMVCNANPAGKQVLVAALANLGKILSGYKSATGGKP